MIDATVTAIILAAGSSSRMKRFKPLLPLGRWPLVEWPIRLFQSAGIEDVCVVVGHRAAELVPRVEALGARTVVNRRYRDGMFSSIRTALRGLPSKAGAFFILPVDLPLVRRCTLLDLWTAFCRGRATICHPTFLGRRGHPPLIAASLAEAMLRWNGVNGLRGFLAQHRDEAVEVPVVDRFILKDLDLADDYRWMKRQVEHRDVPAAAECRALLKRLNLPGAVLDHGRTVAAEALRLGKALNQTGRRLDLRLIVAVALWHELGEERVGRAAQGVGLPGDLGFPRVAQIVNRHPALDPPENAPATEAEVVFVADQRVHGNRPR